MAIKDSEKAWYVYMLRTAAGALYTGISTEPDRRIKQHQSGIGGARSLRGKGPLTLVWVQQVADRAHASRIESHIKKQKKTFKEHIVATEGTVIL